MTSKKRNHKFTNLKCYKKAWEPYKTLFDGVLFLISYFKKHFQFCLFILKALKDILKHFKLVNLWFHFFDVTNWLYLWIVNNHGNWSLKEVTEDTRIYFILSGCLVFQLSGCPVVRFSGFPVFRLSGFPVAGCPVFRFSGCPVFRLSGN